MAESVSRDRTAETQNVPSTTPGYWTDGELPQNVHLGPDTLLSGPHIFRQFRSTVDRALIVGASCTLDNVHFALGKEARVEIGNFCYFSNAMLLCELELRIGSYVVLGWNSAVADTDFHPVAPAERIADAIACSPLGHGRPRPPIVRLPVVIEDDVWIGPNVTILKGVRIGSGSFVEAGTVVTRNVPPHSRVLGNPARVVEEL